MGVPGSSSVGGVQRFCPVSPCTPLLVWELQLLVLWSSLTSMASPQTACSKEMFQFLFPQLPPVSHFPCQVPPVAPSPRPFFLNSCPSLRNSRAASVWIDLFLGPAPWAHSCSHVHLSSLAFDSSACLCWVRPPFLCPLSSCHSWVIIQMSLFSLSLFGGPLSLASSVKYS